MAQMILAHGDYPTILSQQKLRPIKYPSGARRFDKTWIIRGSHNLALQKVDAQGSIARIKEMFGKVQLSPSSYDTAWVAMVPSRGALKEPLFPESVDWIMQNQHPNGSWGLNPSHPLLVKDSPSHRHWHVCLPFKSGNLANNLFKKVSLDFIGSNHFYVNDKQQPSPIGFDIVFPGMVSKAIELGLNLPLDAALVDIMLSNAEHKVKSFRDKSSIAYVAEAFGEAYSWKEVMTHRRSNGSLFNSPATTAASLIHLHDDKSVDQYLRSLLNLYAKSVPTAYPFDIYSRLSVVDTVMKLGIDRHFGVEIESAQANSLDTTSGDHPFDPYISFLKPNGVLVLVGGPNEVKFSPMSLMMGIHCPWRWHGRQQWQQWRRGLRARTGGLAGGGVDLGDCVGMAAAGSDDEDGGGGAGVGQSVGWRRRRVQAFRVGRLILGDKETN
ncbi:hypothetical protein RJ639_043247 [Escallonia herrerae]|uniref:Terpene synthase N-terminal domain-containing protein n=1 Tax=Escallonia herrerae TaxID=1293975 RepID=A0AA88WGE6_9ASTE|nr:hypothetical protein RJ639_043247 [Escallonia herrerae]